MEISLEIVNAQGVDERFSGWECVLKTRHQVGRVRLGAVFLDHGQAFKKVG